MGNGGKMESRNMGTRQKETTVPGEGKGRERMLVASERSEEEAKAQTG